MCSTHTTTFPDNNALSNNPHNNPFLPRFSSSPGWLLVTRTRGAWWCRYRGHWRSGPRHLSPRSRVCAQEWHSEDIHSLIHSHPIVHTPQKKKKKKRRIKKGRKKWWKAHLNSPNMMPSFNCPLPVQCGGGRLSASSAPAPQDFSTSEAFSPRTVLTENTCRCVQHIRQHFPTTMAFLTTPTITLSCFASAAHQADSWWLGHVEPDDVVIADIGGQALDIFLHGPESAHKIGILKTFTHIHSHSLTHPFPSSRAHSSKKKKKKKGKKWWKAHLNSPNMMPSFNCPLNAGFTFFCAEFLLHIPCWPHFIWVVSLTHPMLDSFLSGEYLLHIPC